MKKLLLTLVAPLALGTPALADDYTDGLHAGGTIITCEYYQNGKFKDMAFGKYMLSGQFKDLGPSEQTGLLKLWQGLNYTRCLNTVR